MKIKKPKFKIRLRKNFTFRFFPRLTRRKMEWKDKWNVPRCEHVPHFYFEWLWFVIYGEWGCERYWEQLLWITEYNDGDYAKAKSTWPWTHGTSKESTWNDSLTKKER